MEEGWVRLAALKTSNCPQKKTIVRLHFGPSFTTEFLFFLCFLVLMRMLPLRGRGIALATVALYAVSALTFCGAPGKTRLQPNDFSKRSDSWLHCTMWKCSSVPTKMTSMMCFFSLVHRWRGISPNQNGGQRNPPTIHLLDFPYNFSCVRQVDEKASGEIYDQEESILCRH